MNLIIAIMLGCTQATGARATGTAVIGYTTVTGRRHSDRITAEVDLDTAAGTDLRPVVTMPAAGADLGPEVTMRAEGTDLAAGTANQSIHLNDKIFFNSHAYPSVRYLPVGIIEGL